MDRGAWKVTVHGVARVGHDLVTTPSLICGILNTTQMNLSTKRKQIHRHREQTRGEVRCERGGLGGWGQQIQTTLWRMDKQHSPTV